MYKRYWLGAPAQETHTVGGVFKFFVFCTLVIWLLPAGIEAVSDMPLDLFAVPPIWRAEIICADSSDPDDRDYKYILDGNTCTKECTKPGCTIVDPTKTLTKEQIRDNYLANISESRRDLGVHNIFEITMLALRYGTLLTALGSLGVMMVGAVRLPAWWLLCVPCVVMAVVVGMMPELLPLAAGAWAAAYAADLWSTRRFDDQDIIRGEVNPFLRRLLRRYGVRYSFILHPIIYVGGVVGTPFLVEPFGPLAWYQVMGMMMFGLAGLHVLVAANNIREHRHSRLV